MTYFNKIELQIRIITGENQEIGHKKAVSVHPCLSGHYHPKTYTVQIKIHIVQQNIRIYYYYTYYYYCTNYNTHYTHHLRH